METTVGEFSEALGRAEGTFGLTIRDSDIQQLTDYGTSGFI
jgi:hypothetical protein